MEDGKAKEDKKEEQVNKKRELLEQYAKIKKEISENVEPDWNMKAIDAGNVVKYRANPRKEKILSLKMA